MALYMLTGRYTPAALKAVIESGSDREAAARSAAEAVGGKLLGFYGMFGQEHQVAVIVDVPGNTEYLAAVMPAIASGMFESYKTIPLYSAGEVVKAVSLSKKVREVYRPPGA
jgi:uncharacterized protein with GYD domain